MPEAQDKDRDRTEAIRERLRSRAADYLGGAPSATSRVTEGERLSGSGTGEARIFLIEGGAATRRVFVKAYADGQRRAYRHEVEALASLGPCFATEGRYRMPQLLDSWDDLATVVLPVIEGRSVADLLGSGGGRALLGHAGAWLAHLHSATYEGEGRLGEGRVGELHGRLERALAAAGLAASFVGRRALEHGRRLIQLEQAVRDLPLPMARCHGDFNLRNLMLDAQGRVWGIDACATRVEPVYIEAMHCIATLQVGRRPLLWPPLLRQLERAFLMGYARGVGFPLTNRDLGLRACRAYAYLRLLANALERWGRQPSWARAGTAAWVWLAYLRPLRIHLGAAERAARTRRGGAR